MNKPKTPAMIDAEVAQEAQDFAVLAIKTALKERGVGEFCGSVTGTHSRIVTFRIGDEVLTVRWVWPG